MTTTIYVIRALGGVLLLGASGAAATQSTLILRRATHAISGMTAPVVYEAFSPRYVGDTSSVLAVSFQDYAGNVDDLTNASGLTLKLHNMSNGTTIAGTGAWTVTNAGQGLATYTWSTNDVAQAGFYALSVSALMTDGETHWDARTIEFLPVF